jgi:hypothetical protein
MRSMRERFIGLTAIAALLWIAYHASEQTTSGWRSGSSAAAAAEVPGATAKGARFVPDAEAVIGRPHDGIRALPTRRVQLARHR